MGFKTIAFIATLASIFIMCLYFPEFGLTQDIVGGKTFAKVLKNNEKDLEIIHLCTGNPKSDNMLGDISNGITIQHARNLSCVFNNISDEGFENVLLSHFDNAPLEHAQNLAQAFAKIISTFSSDFDLLESLPEHRAYLLNKRIKTYCPLCSY